MAEVIWRNDALANLDSIRDYIRRFDPDATARIAQGLFVLGESLAEFPNRGRPAGSGTREMVTVPPYILIYEVRAGTVYILAIRHGRQRAPIA